MTEKSQPRSIAAAWPFQASLRLPLALIAVCAVFTAIKPVFLSPDNLISIVHQVAIIGIMAIGMTFVIMTGGIDLSIGPVLAIAGVFAADILGGHRRKRCAGNHRRTHRVGGGRRRQRLLCRQSRAAADRRDARRAQHRARRGALDRRAGPAPDPRPGVLHLHRLRA